MLVLILDDDDHDARRLGEILARLLPGAIFKRVSTESEFHEKFAQLMEPLPSLIIMDLLVRWRDPSAMSDSLPENVRVDGPYTAGLRCAKMVAASPHSTAVPIIIYSAVSRSDLTGLPSNVIFLSKTTGEEGLSHLVRSLFAGGLAPTRSQAVFVVHGHDGEAKEAVARFIEGLGLRAIILHEQSNRGNTLIEKLEKHSDVAYAVILLTGDDIGAVKGSPKNMRPRARQNVIYELGFFSAKLGREKVCALIKDGTEVPSDVSGVAYIRMDSAGAWRTELAREMKAAGLSLDLNRLAEH